MIVYYEDANFRKMKYDVKLLSDFLNLLWTTFVLILIAT